jgi:hypothetical protein
MRGLRISLLLSSSTVTTWANMWIQRLLWCVLAALALGQTNAPPNIASTPGYDSLSLCSQCALRLPGSIQRQCTANMDSIIPNLVGCSDGIDWACVCTPINLNNIINRIMSPSFNCAAEDPANATLVLQTFCAIVSGGDSVRTLSPPATVTATQTPSLTPSVNIPLPSQQTTASTATPDSGNAGGITSGWIIVA